MRKPAFCICENKGPDQLHGYHGQNMSDQVGNPKTSFLTTWLMCTKSGEMITIQSINVVVVLGFYVPPTG